MKSFKKECYIFLIILLNMLTSCQEGDSLSLIAGLDFEIILYEAGTEIGVLAVILVANNRINYTIDFGEALNDNTDVFKTDGEMVSYEYPNKSETYEIKVTASLSKKDDVVVVKYYTVIVKETLVGTWKLESEAGVLSTDSNLENLSLWSNALEDVLARTCLFDDEYVLNSEGTFQNISGLEIWVEEWQGVVNEGCAIPVFQYNGVKSVTWEYDQAAGTVTINGTGEYLGLAKIFNCGELTSSSETVDSKIYTDTLIGNTLIIDVEIANGVLVI